MKKLLCLMLVVAIGTIAQAQDNPKPSFGKKIFGWASKIFTKKEKPVVTEEETKAIDAKEESKELPQEVAISPAEKERGNQDNLPRNVGLSPGGAEQNGEIGNLPKPVSLAPQSKDERQGGDLPKGVALQPSEKEKTVKTLPIPVVLDPDYSTGGEIKTTKEKSDSVNSANTDTVRQNYTSPGGQNQSNQQTQTASNNAEQNKKQSYYNYFCKICKHNCFNPEHYEVQEVVVVNRPVRRRPVMIGYYGYYNNSWGVRQNNCNTYNYKRSYSKPMKNYSKSKTMAYNGPRRSGR